MCKLTPRINARSVGTPSKARTSPYSKTLFHRPPKLAGEFSQF